MMKSNIEADNPLVTVQGNWNDRNSCYKAKEIHWY